MIRNLKGKLDALRAEQQSVSHLRHLNLSLSGKPSVDLTDFYIRYRKMWDHFR